VKNYRWFSSDNKQNFRSNKERYPGILESLNWTDETVINYGINEQGFRTDNIVEPRDVLWIGCSSTFGVGINESDTFPHIVSKEKGWSYYNLSRQGVGFEFYYRAIKEYIDVIKPKHVLVVDPSTLSRREILCDNGKNISITKMQPRGTSKDFLSYDPKDLLGGREIKIMTMRTRDAIRWVCRKTNLVFIENLTNEFTTYSARDLIHPGIEDHKKMASHLKGIL